MPDLQTVALLALEIVGGDGWTEATWLTARGRVLTLLEQAPEVLGAQDEKTLTVQSTDRRLVLLFRGDVRAPLRTAIFVDQERREAAEFLERELGAPLELRMAVHTGQVQVLEHLIGSPDSVGPGIDRVLQVLACGDAGHILVSEEVARGLFNDWEFGELLQNLGVYWLNDMVSFPLASLCRRAGVDPPIGNAQVPTAVAKSRSRVIQERARHEEHLAEQKREERIAGVWRAVIYFVVAVLIISLVIYSILTPMDRRDLAQHLFQKKPQ